MRLTKKHYVWIIGGLVLVLLLLWLGIKGQNEKAENARVFFDLLHAPSIHWREKRQRIRELVKDGASVSDYQLILSRANRVEKTESHVWYLFFKPEDMQGEGTTTFLGVEGSTTFGIQVDVRKQTIAQIEWFHSEM